MKLRKSAAVAIAGVTVGATMAIAPSPAHAATFEACTEWGTA